MRIGLLGGTFNPPHRAHRALAAAALADGRIDALVLVPAGLPPHKAADGLPAPEHRLAMTRLLAADLAGASVDGRELRRAGPSFTIDTVRALAAERPGDRFRLIIGWDMAESFATWREADALARLAPPLVAWRPESGGVAGDGDAPDPSRLPPLLRAAMAGERLLRMVPSPISSRAIRARIAAGAGDNELLASLTPPVLAYIREHDLYAGGRG